MDRTNRKVALAAYKERKAPAGVFAVRCLVDGRRWLGRTPDLTKAQNGLWFALRMGGSPFRSLQAHWQAHGEGAFVFEEVERLPEDTEPFARDRLLKQRLDHWKTEWGADPL